MKITVWTLASDDQNGTQAAAFTTEHDAQTAFYNAVFEDDGPTQREAKKALDAADYDELRDIADKYLEGSYDTYSVSSQELETPAPAITKIWTLACDDDSSTRAFVFTTAEDAVTELIEQALCRSEADRTAAEEALKRGDLDAAKEIAYSYLSNFTHDTYTVEEHDITPPANAQCVPAEELAADRAQLSPEDRAKLDELETNFQTEHEALTVAIEMLNRIAQGKSYDSASYYNALEAMRAVNQIETEQEKTTRENIEAITATDLELFDKACAMQTAFWDAVSALEDAIGFEIDSSHDLSVYTLETLDEIEEK